MSQSLGAQPWVSLVEQVLMQQWPLPAVPQWPLWQARSVSQTAPAPDFSVQVFPAQ
jgi:hypothetical protein